MELRSRIKLIQVDGIRGGWYQRWMVSEVDGITWTWVFFKEENSNFFFIRKRLDLQIFEYITESKVVNKDVMIWCSGFYPSSSIFQWDMLCYIMRYHFLSPSCVVLVDSNYKLNAFYKQWWWWIIFVEYG